MNPIALACGVVGDDEVRNDSCRAEHLLLTLHALQCAIAKPHVCTVRPCVIRQFLGLGVFVDADLAEQLDGFEHARG